MPSRDILAEASFEHDFSADRSISIGRLGSLADAIAASIPSELTVLSALIIKMGEQSDESGGGNISLSDTALAISEGPLIIRGLQENNG